MGGKVTSGAAVACAAGSAVGAFAYALGSPRYILAGVVAAGTALMIAAAALYGLPPEHEERWPMHQHAMEYKAACPAGHRLFGPGATCGRCDPDTAPIILETKEGGRAVAYPDPWETTGEPWEDRL